MNIPACVSRVHCGVVKYKNGQLHTVMASGFPKKIELIYLLLIIITEHLFIYLLPIYFSPSVEDVCISFAHSNILVCVFLMTRGNSLYILYTSLSVAYLANIF